MLFSKDRPLQLQATLESLAMFGKHIGHIKVIFKGCAEEYRRVAQRMAKRHRQRVQLIEERVFYDDMLGQLHPLYSHVLFLVDDTVFYRPFDLRRCCQVLQEKTDVLGVSLRLGHNTTTCYMSKSHQRFHEVKKDGSRFRTWDWTKSDHDAGYPFDLSSSVYRIAQMDQLLKTCRRFTNPNSMEHYMSLEAEKYHAQPRLASYHESVAFSNPMNLTQTQYIGNRNNGDHLYTTSRLLRAFQEGQEMDLKDVDQLRPPSAHYEWAFPLRQSD